MADGKKETHLADRPPGSMRWHDPHLTLYLSPTPPTRSLSLPHVLSPSADPTTFALPYPHVLCLVRISLSPVTPQQLRAGRRRPPWHRATLPSNCPILSPPSSRPRPPSSSSRPRPSSPWKPAPSSCLAAPPVSQRPTPEASRRRPFPSAPRRRPRATSSLWRLLPPAPPLSGE